MLRVSLLKRKKTRLLCFCSLLLLLLLLLKRSSQPTSKATAAPAEATHTTEQAATEPLLKEGMDIATDDVVHIFHQSWKTSKLPPKFLRHPPTSSMSRTEVQTMKAATAPLTEVSRPAIESIEVGVVTDGVVRIFHQSWKTSKLPPRFQRWSQSFSSCLPGWQRRLWTDEDNEKLVAEHFPWFLPTYRKLYQPVQRADVSRLLYMYKYGGAYCDLDCECLNPFEHLFVNVSLAFGAMEGHSTGPQDDRYMVEGQVENSFMYSVPGHPFIMELIKQVEKRPFGSPEDTTGPYLLMRAINRKRKSPDGMPSSFKGLKYLTIFPPMYFNPFTWLGKTEPACKDKGGFTRSEEELCRMAFRNSSFVLQYHTQMWLAGGQYLTRD